jgi:hypothetical protein
MRSVCLAACLAGQLLCRFPQPFSPAALRRFKVCLLAKQVEADSLAIAFRSPASSFGRPIPATGSPLLACRFAFSRPAVRLARSIPGSQPRPFPVSGLFTTRNPLPTFFPSASCLSLYRRSPSGLSSLRILALRPEPLLPTTHAPGWGLAGKLAVMKRPISPHSPPTCGRRIIVPSSLHPNRLTVPRHTRVRSAFRFSQPLSGLRLGLLRGLISCPSRSWGSPFRVFPSQQSPNSCQARFPS